MGLSRQENSLCGPNSRSTHRRRRDSAIPPEIDTSCSAGDKQIVEDAPPLIGSHPSRCPDGPPGMARFERSTAVSDTIASSPRTYCPSCRKRAKTKTTRRLVAQKSRRTIDYVRASRTAARYPMVSVRCRPLLPSSSWRRTSNPPAETFRCRVTTAFPPLCV